MLVAEIGSYSRIEKLTSMPLRTVTQYGHLYADIFAPEVWTLLDEVTHERDAFIVLYNLEGDAVASHVVLGALEVHVFADHDSGDLI